MVVASVERKEGLEPPVKPRQCPRAPAGAVCRVSWQGWRKRATGAVRRLRKARCRGHERYFTVYPCGQVPYGRRRVAPVEPGGRAVVVEAGEARSEAWREGLPEASEAHGTSVWHLGPA